MSESWDRWRRRATGVPRHRWHGMTAGLQRRPWWLRTCIVSLLLLVTLFTGATGGNVFDGISVAFASPAGTHAQRPSDSGTPNRFDPKSHASSTPRTTQGPGPSSASKIPGGPPVHMPHQYLFSMRPGLLPLHANANAHFDGSDGRLSVDAPAGAVTDAELAAAAGGSLGLRITQIATSSGSSAGGSGLVSFGTYLIQVVDAQGVLVKHGLHKPVTLTLHYGSRDSALDLSRAFVVFNGSLPNGVDVAPLAAATNEPVAPGTRRGTTAPASGTSSAVLPNGDVDPAAIGLGSYSSQHVAFDPKKHTLTVQPLLSTPSSSMSWNTNAAVSSFGKPDPFNVDLSGGALSAGYPIDVPAGPGGLTPPVSLSYSSAGVTEGHGPQAAAGWVGEGWNLGLGAISWAEHNVTSSCASTCGNTWEDSWQLSDPFGTGAELIPPNINVATYYDDSPYNITPSPVQWHTAPETHAKVYSYVGPVNPPDSANVHTPCFRVFLTNGIMEEFGCTSDSLEYYYTPGMGDYIANWNLDLITDPQGNQIHITYQQDTEQKNVSGTNHTYIRDAVLSTIEYDSPGCRNAQTACTGTAWAPLARVNFVAGHSPARLTNTPANCNTGTNLRCDDPFDLSGSNGLGVPDVQSTFVLNDVQVQVRSSGTASWNTLKDYQLKYEQNGPQSPVFTDPSTGKSESPAGRLLLKNLIEVGTDGTTALPTRSFGYSQVTQYYEDDLFHPNPTTNCGPSWNTGNGGGCILWSQNYDTNSWFLNTADNGLGLHQDFAWALARNNTHKTNGNVAANNANPFYCNGVTGYPCNEADDQNWSRVVLTSETSSVVRAAAGGNQTVSSTTSYSYLLKTALNAQECSDCGVDMYWGNINDGDYLDYYNTKYMGFAETDVTQPDGAKDVHKFLTTDGYGIYDTSQVNCYAGTQPVGTCGNDAWWRLDNVGHGREYETDSYDTNGTTLLKQTVNQYRALCPASGVSGTPAWTGTPNYGNWNGNLVSELDHNNPVSSCDVQLAQSFDYDIEGSSAGSTAPTVAKIYTYDNYGRPSVTSTRSNGEPGLVTVEAESAAVVSAGASTSVVNNCCGVQWSNGAERVLWATAAGQALTLSFSVPSTGTYNVTGLITQAADNSISSFAIDGSALGSTFDGYNSYVTPAMPVGYGQMTLTAGTHQATWTATGKNTASSNYYISIDALVLQKTGTTPAISLNKPQYIYNDAVSATSSGATGTYLIENTAFSDNEDALGNRYSCSYTSYDGQGYNTGQQSTLTLGEVTQADVYTNCGTPPSYGPSGILPTRHTYDAWGNQITTTDPDGVLGVSGHVGCTVSSVQYTTCDAFDSTFETLPTSSSNALNQTTTTGYTATAAGGFGLWPTSTVDFNGQTTSYAYDALGRMTGTTLPGETAGLTTTGWVYTVWCNATGAQAPCVEMDEVARINDATTVTKRAFYDGYGDLVETRSPGPNNQDVVTYADRDASHHITFESNSYFVPAYTGAPGATAFSTPDATQPGTHTTYDGLERTLSVKDPLSFTTNTSYAVACNLVSADGSSCYVQTTAIDALSHEHITYTDPFGQLTYDDRFTGNNGGTYALYALTHYTYDFNGHLVTITHPNNSTTTTFGYDAAGRKTSQSDPDLGTTTYGYDANGSLTQMVDARGAGGTVYAGYDGLDRLLWRNTTNSPTGARVTYTYDSTTGGNYGVGRKTGESFSDGSLTGAYSYSYDLRGRAKAMTTTVNGTNYTVSKTFDDANNTLAQTYPTGEVVQSSFTGQGWLGQVTDTQGTTTTTLANNITYTGAAGASSTITGMSLGGGVYTYAASYDLAHRLTGVSLTRASDNTLLYQSQPSYDGKGNVTGVTTTLPATGGGTGTDAQAFCYDEQDRLTWASSASGTIPCGGTNTAGTLTAAGYTQSFAYDNLGRLTTGPAGSYTYGDSAHLHAVTSSSGGYTASYDAAGNMTCRAPSSGSTCTGTPTGQKLTFDAEGWLTAWQNTPSAPTSTASYLYDGEGERVAQQATTSGATTTTAYIGNIEEVATSGTTTTTTTYYYAADIRVALAVNGSFTYLSDDVLTSQTAAFNASGSPVASVLYGPYGSPRYSNGAMPGSFGFTGQRADSVTGLDYYHARYYDPAAGQFISADSVLGDNGANPWELSRYGYVEGNPETKTDPSGHCPMCITALIGAVVGAAIGAGTAIASQQASGHCCDWGKVAGEAAIGALSGAITGALGPVGGAVSTVLVHAIVGGAVGAGAQAASNLVEGKPLGDGVLTAAIIGGVTGGISGGIIARQAAKAAGPLARAASCALSFSPDTQVATPSGEQAIGTMQVGDQVTAYDPQTGQTSAQPVLHVWINHDSDLVDVTLRSDTSGSQPSAAASDAKVRAAELKAHGLRAPPDDQADIQAAADNVQAPATAESTEQSPHSTNQTTRDETVHTTAKHPWLTTDRGFVPVARLRVGERVVREDGTPATIVALRVVRGEANYYNLEVAQLHTFAVGIGKYVVHNCGNEAYARQLANGIRDNINERLAGKTIQPFRVAVGFVREGDSMITVVSANRNFFRYVRGAEDLLRDAASEVLPESNRVIRRASTLIGRGHAEDYIAQFVRGGRGARRLLAISPSDGFDPTFPGAVGPCSYCRGMLSRLVRTGR